MALKTRKMNNATALSGRPHPSQSLMIESVVALWRFYGNLGWKAEIICCSNFILGRLINHHWLEAKEPQEAVNAGSSDVINMA